jgi:hypothetical protein
MAIKKKIVEKGPLKQSSKAVIDSKFRTKSVAPTKMKKC